MIVKIGDKITNSEDEPIAILFTENEKKLISNMGKQGMLCSYPDKWNDVEFIKDFMNELHKTSQFEGEEHGKG